MTRQIGSFEKCNRARTLERLRGTLVRELDEEAEKVRAEVKRSIHLFHYSEAWINAFLVKHVLTEDSTSYHVLNEPMKSDGWRYLSARDFEERIEYVKSSIQRGRLDHFLKMKGGEVLWESMEPDGKLLPRPPVKKTRIIPVKR